MEQNSLFRQISALFFWCFFSIFHLSILFASPKIDLYKVLEINLDSKIGQLRAVPVALGVEQAPAILLIYSEDAEIDPYIGMFFFPKGTTKLMLIDEGGTELWFKDLGPGMVSGIWFLPVFPFDLDQNGIDEIWLVNNSDPEHPLDHRRYVLERLNGLTGEVMGEWKWPEVSRNQSMSHQYRNFILGGYVYQKPVLVTTQGTYGEMNLQAWNNDLSNRWTYTIPADSEGGKGSHVCPVVDINFDGCDEFMWGERCISFDTGNELFCADRKKWRGHSDIIQPVLDRKNNQWYIFTCREQNTNQPPRMAVFNNNGEKVWGCLEQGHIDTGWAARLGINGEPVVLGVRVGEKVRSAAGEFRLKVEPFTCEAFTGKPFKLNFNPYTTIPVDLNGDGIHELVKGYFEGDGTVFDREGNILGNVQGLTAMNSKFMNLPGEQILSYNKDKGKVMIWADRNAEDNRIALARYSHPFYRINQRLTACGYNLFNLGGI
jgi:hypothetical protein